MTIDRLTPVLVVDDHETMIKIIRGQLRELGFVDVHEANSGAEALTKMRARRFGLIFSDWHMESITGLELLRTVRGDLKLKQIPFIMVTEESRSENVIAAKKAGVSGYIVKPFNAQMLKAKIETVFATRAAALAKRQAISLSHPPRSGEASDATPTSDPPFSKNFRDVLPAALKCSAPFSAVSTPFYRSRQCINSTLCCAASLAGNVPCVSTSRQSW
jgi:two-component system chemotaxis response regulator CheY